MECTDRNQWEIVKSAPEEKELTQKKVNVVRTVILFSQRSIMVIFYNAQKKRLYSMEIIFKSQSIIPS